MLAMLLWLVELAQYIQQVDGRDGYGGVQDYEDMNQFAERTFYDYLVKSYPIWLNSGDESSELENRLAQQLGKLKTKVDICSSFYYTSNIFY